MDNVKGKRGELEPSRLGGRCVPGRAAMQARPNRQHASLSDSCLRGFGAVAAQSPAPQSTPACRRQARRRLAEQTGEGEAASEEALREREAQTQLHQPAWMCLHPSYARTRAAALAQQQQVVEQQAARPGGLVHDGGAGHAAAARHRLQRSNQSLAGRGVQARGRLVCRGVGKSSRGRAVRPVCMPLQQADQDAGSRPGSRRQGSSQHRSAHPGRAGRGRPRAQCPR